MRELLKIWAMVVLAIGVWALLQSLTDPAPVDDPAPVHARAGA